jgi:hypothetical protein
MNGAMQQSPQQQTGPHPPRLNFGRVPPSPRKTFSAQAPRDQDLHDHIAPQNAAQVHHLAAAAWASEQITQMRAA